jgi:hypothetical protein
LVNSDARLWCEACTALKPRQLAGQHRQIQSQLDHSAGRFRAVCHQ